MIKKQSLFSDHKLLEKLWKFIGEKVWKPLKIFTATVWLKSLTMSQLLFYFFHSISKQSWRVPSRHSFYWFVLTISERGLYLITTLTSPLHVLISPRDEGGGSEADTYSTQLWCCARGFLWTLYGWMGVFWEKKAYKGFSQVPQRRKAAQLRQANPETSL